MKLSDKKKIKLALKELYAAPEQQQKKEFLSSIRLSKRISGIQVVLAQLFYIRKLVWIFSAALAGMVIWFSRFVSMETMWLVSACIPFIAMIGVSENMRSVTYGMSELEMVSRFSIKSIIFARMTAIGMFHLILLLAINAVVVRSSGELDFFMSGVYLFVPYLMTTSVSMYVTRKLRKREVNYVCMGIAIIVAAVDFVLKSMMPLIGYEKESQGCWVFLFLVLIVCTMTEYLKIFFGWRKFYGAFG